MPRTTLLRKQVTPTGTIQPHAGSTAPEGFLVCDGTIVDIADYPRLYAIIGTSWGHGNNDGLTFHLPDLRGRFLRGSTEGMTPAEAAARDPDYASRTPSNAGGATQGATGSVQAQATGKNGMGVSLANLTGSRSTNVRGTHVHNGYWRGGYASSSIAREANIRSPYDGFGGPGTVVLSGGGHSHSVNISHGHSVTVTSDAETRPINANVNYVIKAV